MYGICVLKKKIFFQKSKAWVTTYKINGKIKWKIAWKIDGVPSDQLQNNEAIRI